MEGRDIRWGNVDTPTRLRFARHKTNTPERFVPITDELSATLEAWVGKMGVGPGRRVFAHLTAAVIRYAHEERAAPAVGRDGRLPVKDLRHVAPMRWLEAGCPLQTVQKWLGHATILQTMRYLESVPKGAEEKALLKKLAGTWDGSRGVGGWRSDGGTWWQAVAGYGGLWPCRARQ